jgi:hypothetical protein
MDHKPGVGPLRGVVTAACVFGLGCPIGRRAGSLARRRDLVRSPLLVSRGAKIQLTGPGGERPPTPQQPETLRVVLFHGDLCAERLPLNFDRALITFCRHQGEIQTETAGGRPGDALFTSCSRYLLYAVGPGAGCEGGFGGTLTGSSPQTVSVACS